MSTKPPPSFVRLMERGLRPVEIAAHTGVRESTVRIYASAAGFLPAPSGCISRDELARLDATMTRDMLVEQLGYKRRGDGLRALSIFLDRRRGADRGESESGIEALTVPDAPEHPYWTPERDVLLLKSGGTYEGLNRVCEILDRPYAFCLARWHRIRRARLVISTEGNP